MIVVKLIGGLGNQLFQYALARRIAHIYNVPLKLDITSFETYKLHKYSLKPFNIIENFASNREIAKLKTGHPFHNYVQMLFPYYKRTFVREQFFHFDANILKAGAATYIEGYWQSEKYFKKIEDIIRSEFSIKLQPDLQNQNMADMISNVNAVSLHIRRGDYVSDAKTNSILGICSLDYYQEAVRVIAGHAESLHFFIFSDDSEWAECNLKLSHPTTFVKHNDASKNYEDLRLMSLCKHNIIANSSFSWWGAWLNKNPDKIVIAPGKWFNDPGYNTQDLLPESWIKL